VKGTCTVSNCEKSKVLKGNKMSMHRFNSTMVDADYGGNEVSDHEGVVKVVLKCSEFEMHMLCFNLAKVGLVHCRPLGMIRWESKPHGLDLTFRCAIRLRGR
jgi:hypothetical protein